VPISLALVERLLTRYPGTVVGIKGSSADWQNSKALLDAFPGFDVFVGTENLLLQNMRHGGAGCISATANVNPARIHNLYANWQSRDADQLQTELDKVRAAHARYPMIAALKATISIFSGQDEWRQVRPPLVALNEALAQALEADLRGLNFTMPQLSVDAARKGLPT
jgi:4-hydroxy-tetrahydrodipicolinate synthase